MSELTRLHVRRGAALVQGTIAERLHPDWVADEEGDDAYEPDVQDADDATDEGVDEEPGIERGTSLQLLGRIELGEFYFRPGAAREASGSYYTPTPMVDDLARGALAPLVEGRTAAEIELTRPWLWLAASTPMTSPISWARFPCLRVSVRNSWHIYRPACPSERTKGDLTRLLQ